MESKSYCWKNESCDWKTSLMSGRVSHVIGKQVLWLED